MNENREHQAGVLKVHGKRLSSHLPMDSKPTRFARDMFLDFLQRNLSEACPLLSIRCFDTGIHFKRMVLIREHHPCAERRCEGVYDVSVAYALGTAKRKMLKL